MPNVDLGELFKESDDISGLVPVVLAEIESGELTVLKLVELLGSWLTNLDKDKRREGTSLLAGVLNLISSQLLLETECLFMVSFFCDRLKDHYSVVPHALSGLAALSSMDNFPDNSPHEIISAVQENVTCQALTQQQRHSFYLILHNILIKKSNMVSTKFPSEYMYALISGMDSESDPRNLLFLFSFLPKAFSEIPLKHLCEEAFAVLECYFPVDFTPVEEKGNVTREDLAKGLEACLVANSAFAEHCVRMACEKMSSGLKVALMDSLRLITSGFRNWSIELTTPFIKKLWFCIKDYLIHGNDQEVSSLARKALISLLSAFFKNAPSGVETESLMFLLDNISSSTHCYLGDPSLSLFLPTLRLLSDVIAVSSTTAHFILPKILPQLLALLDANSDQKDIILRALSPILVSSVKYNCWETGSCEEHLNKILPIALKSIEDDKCRGSGFSCLTAVISKLPFDVRSLVYKVIPKIICSESFQSSSEEFAMFIRTLSEEYTLEVENQLISTFKIPETFRTKEVKNYLEFVTWIMDFLLLTRAAATVILNHIIMDEFAVWRSDAVFVLRNYVGKADEKVLRCLSSECGFPQKLLSSYFSYVSGNEIEVASVAAIVARIIQVLDVAEQRAILTMGLELFNRSTSNNHVISNQLVLLEGLACGLQRDLDIENSVQFSECLLEYSISCDSDVGRTSAARLLAVIINKIKYESELDEILKLAKIKIQTSPGMSSVRLSAWITKSLILRGYYPVCDDWLVELLNLVKDPLYGIDAAECVGLLLEECPFFSEANHCVVGLLYKQRIFQKIDLLIPQDGIPSKSVSLALAYILKYAPSSLVLGVISELTGVMVHCLESDDSRVVLPVLEILSSLLESCVNILCTLAETYIPRCISLAQTSPYMAVRKEALNCIFLYGKYSPVDMLPYKNMVLVGLQKCLDDKKRLVRQCTVRARTRWFLV